MKLFTKHILFYTAVLVVLGVGCDKNVETEVSIDESLSITSTTIETDIKDDTTERQANTVEKKEYSVAGFAFDLTVPESFNVVISPSQDHLIVESTVQSIDGTPSEILEVYVTTTRPFELDDSQNNFGSTEVEDGWYSYIYQLAGRENKMVYIETKHNYFVISQSTSPVADGLPSSEWLKNDKIIEMIKNTLHSISSTGYTIIDPEKKFEAEKMYNLMNYTFTISHLDKLDILTEENNNSEIKIIDATDDSYITVYVSNEQPDTYTKQGGFEVEGGWVYVGEFDRQEEHSIRFKQFDDEYVIVRIDGASNPALSEAAGTIQATISKK